jgi:signal recognition particle subunit SRP54
MAEMADIKAAANPHEILLVADSLTGQDAVNLARSFDERVGITGIVLTRVDGDGRGGAALSMRAVTGKPIKLIGTGEKIDALEDFHPSASPAASSAWATSSPGREGRRERSTPKRPRRCREDAQGHLRPRRPRASSSADAKMGGMGGLMGMMPGIGKMKNQMAAANIDDKIFEAASMSRSSIR